MNEELHRSIGRLEGKIDHVLNNQSVFKENFERHDNRLRHLESWHYKSLGVIAAISFFFSLAWDWVKTSLFRQ